MDTQLASSIISLVAVVLVIGAVAVAVYLVRKRTREIAQAAFGTNSLIEGFKEMETELENTPKSVSSATSLYLPRIHEDFPEFNFADMRVRAENVLKSYLMALDARNPKLLTEGSKELREALILRIGSAIDSGLREQYDEVKLHRTEIARYEKRNGRCTVTFQSSVQYKYAAFDKDGTVVKGNPSKWTQQRYNVELVYIQDENKVQDDRDRADAVNCPNCGAPVSDLGAKKCAYCGSAIEPYNIRVWAFHRVEEG